MLQKVKSLGSDLSAGDKIEKKRNWAWNLYQDEDMCILHKQAVATIHIDKGFWQLSKTKIHGNLVSLKLV